MDYPNMRLETEGEVARIVIDRTEKRNALTWDMWRAIPRIAGAADADPETKVIVIQGTDESAFAAGADIGEFEKRFQSSESSEAYINDVLAAEAALVGCAKPVIAMIRGDCIGGGVEIAVSCDIRVAADNGRFGITPARLGLCYSVEATKRVMDLVGPAHTKDLLFTGRLFDAAEAGRIGLVDRVVPLDGIERVTADLAAAICRGSQYSVRFAKRAVRAILGGAADEPPELRALRVAAWEAGDLAEGVRAFQEKRKPRFTWNG